MKIYDCWNPPPKVATVVEGESMTDPQYAHDCDINRIMRKADLTGIPSRGDGAYIDVSEVGSFADNLRKAALARSDFESLPSQVRARFGNDPVAFYEFVSTPDNRSECQRLGLIAPDPEYLEPVAPVTKVVESHTESAVAPSTGSAPTDLPK